MLFRYKVLNEKGDQKSGEIEAVSSDFAVSSLQRRGYIVISVEKAGESGFLKKNLPFLDKVPLKDVVMMSQQISSLFDAKISAVKAFDLMGDNIENKILKTALQTISQDIQGGISISDAMRKHTKIFSDFYINMIAAGEESGRLNETFQYLADYLERQHELTAKTRNALIYPIFVIVAFVGVMVLMLTLVIPKLSAIILESGQEIPFYTKVTIALSDFFVNYGFFLLIFVVLGGFYIYRMAKKEAGRGRLDALKLRLPYFGDLFKKIYLSRIADNMHTMLASGIPVVRVLEITGTVVDNKVFEGILNESVESVKAGSMISDAFAKHEEMPNILVHMVRVGEETGSIGDILEKLAKFYKREVDNSVDVLIGLIEPAMIILLGVGVGFLLTSILLPIYNLTSSF